MVNDQSLPTEEHNINDDNLEIKRDLKVTAAVLQGTSNLTNYVIAYFLKQKRLEVAFAWICKLQNLLNNLPLKGKELLLLKRIMKLLHPP